MTERSKKGKKHFPRNAEEKLAFYELLLYEEAYRLDRKRKTCYVG